MKSKRSDMRHRFRTRLIANIVYSSLVACLVEMFLVTNLGMLAKYARESQWNNALMAMIDDRDLVIILGYVLLGVMVFSVTFLLLQEKTLIYIEKISHAVRDISEGDLNTTVDVIGDDEFSSMAENLNKMVEDIRRLMDKELRHHETNRTDITDIRYYDYFFNRCLSLIALAIQYLE